MTRSVDLRGADNLDWTLLRETPSHRYWLAILPDGQQVIKTEFLADEALIEDNKRAYSESEGKRWGDGQIVGRIPLNVLYSSQHQIMEKLKEGDRDHLKWWLNSERALPYRRFKGRI
ncbi:hypothetical protein HJB79_31355 [Rhizobium lentis]|uniref:hypothetical protein n=1 Tax=Rhizobium lentis TaxID=1138194 RepID=UPI001C83221B|nr:hypothetical protein [Rhizobium lentis]MBX5143207.1 hypothetical protein [Rhizobium lentis]